MTAIAAAARVVWSLLVTVTVLGGGAIGLVWWARWPLPDRWPPADAWAEFAEHPLTPQTLKALIACVAWLLWLLLAASTVMQAMARLTRRTLPLRFPRPIQAFAAGLLGASVLTAVSPAAANTSSASVGATADPARDVGPAAGLDHPVHNATMHEHVRGRSDAHRAAPPSTDGGIALPGGWITLPFAAGVLATVAANLLLRRHPQRASAALRAIRASRHPLDDPAGPQQPPEPVDDIALLEHDLGTGRPLCIGVHDGRDLGADLLPPAGVGLIGTGADDAVRGLITAVMAADNARLITTSSLSADLGLPLAASPRVVLAADPADALHLGKLETRRRAAEPAAAPTERISRQPLIVLTDPPHDRRLLAALAALGHPLGLRVVVAGPWSTGATWQVDPHGIATDDGGRVVARLNTLTANTLTAIAELLNPPPVRAEATAIAAPQHRTTVPPLQLSVLGPLRLTTSDNPAVHIRRSGAWQAAVYLVLHPDGARRMDLLEAIFGHMRPANANTGLNSCLHELRRALTANGRTALQSVDGRYRLDPDMVQADLWQLHERLRRGELYQAVQLYTGAVAEGRTWDWLPEHRQIIRHTVADAYAQLARSANTPAAALDLAFAGIAADPYAQQCYETAIRAHLRTGNIHGARAVYRDLADRLHQTGEIPMPEITSLIPPGNEQTTRASSATAIPPHTRQRRSGCIAPP